MSERHDAVIDIIISQSPAVAIGKTRYTVYTVPVAVLTFKVIEGRR